MIRSGSTLWYYGVVDTARELEEPHENILIAQSENELKGELVVHLGGVMKNVEGDTQGLGDVLPRAEVMNDAGYNQNVREIRASYRDHKFENEVNEYVRELVPLDE